jgi:hypothetical protein
MGESNSYKVLGGKPKGKNHFGEKREKKRTEEKNLCLGRKLNPGRRARKPLLY